MRSNSAAKVYSNSEVDQLAEKISQKPTAEAVVTCYAILHRTVRAAGFFDLTDGMYQGDPSRSYEEAQATQARVLVERAGGESKKNLLDIGCGYGRILREGVRVGMKATGITVSPEQAAENKAQGLDVHLLDYKKIDSTGNGRYDAVIANGSMEHFVQSSDALKGEDSDIYTHLFATVHRVLKKPGNRFVTTVIHFNQRPKPEDLLRHPSEFAVGSTERHWANLQRSMGGWYPIKGQLEKCAKPYFELVHEEDGTEDYRITSETWLEGVKAKLYSLSSIPIWAELCLYALRHPVPVLEAFKTYLQEESWQWQFRGNPAPGKLLRQTWVKRS